MSNVSEARPPKYIAPGWHTISFLLLYAFFSYLDVRRANAPQAVHQTASQAPNVVGSMLSIFFEWGMAAWAWAGMRLKGLHLRDLTGGRWRDWRSFAVDFAIAIPFWGLWELTARLVSAAMMRGHAPGSTYQPPHGLVAVLLWILLSISAGITEEIVFRYYFQQQFYGASRSLVVAVLLQAVLFGLVHAYQGWRNVVVIVPLGILYGALVAWRRNLRSSMIAHAISDIFEGWLRFV